MSQTSTLDEAKAINDQINALNPPITYTESAKVAYATTSYSEPQTAEGERDYYSVWPQCGFSQNCALVQQRIDSKAGDWVQGMRDEFKAYQSHEPASNYGLPEGVTWTYVS